MTKYGSNTYPLRHSIRQQGLPQFKMRGISLQIIEKFSGTHEILLKGPKTMHSSI